MIKDEQGMTALIKAAHTGNAAEIKNLITSSNVNLQNANEETALIIASKKGHSQVVKILLDSNADPNIQTFEGQTALIYAAALGKEDTVQHIISCKSTNIELRNNYGDTPLLECAKNGHVSIIKILLQAKANVNNKDGSGYSCLMRCSAIQRIDAIKLLISERANLNDASSDGLTPLILAAGEGHITTVKLLLESKANINTTTKQNGNALIQAASYNRIEVVDILLKEKADLNQINQYGENVCLASLHAGESSIQILKKLLHAKADPNVTDDDGNTCLHLAATEGFLKHVSLLLPSRANPCIRNNQGFTPALCTKDNKLRRLLRREQYEQLTRLVTLLSSCYKSKNNETISPRILDAIASYILGPTVLHDDESLITPRDATPNEYKIEGYNPDAEGELIFIEGSKKNIPKKKKIIKSGLNAPKKINIDDF